MRVFNLTDVKTSVLESRGLVDAPVSVGGVSIQPGESAEVSSTAGSGFLVSVGAVAVGELPAAYVKKKAALRSRALTEGPPPPPTVVVEEPVVEETAEVVEEVKEEKTEGKSKKKKSRRGNR